MTESWSRWVVCSVFVMSGATGLAYESLWVHYLKLYLGHAAYAQSFVLITFMGGIALGARLAGSWVARLSRPMFAYAFVECAIGLSAFAFPHVFTALNDATFEWLIPNYDLGTALPFVKWLLASVTILPQTLLLGATFPLMVAVFSALEKDLNGRGIANVYFLNSGGAAIGVLLTGFYLVPTFGLPVAMGIAGFVNLMLVPLILLCAAPSQHGAPRESNDSSLKATQMLIVAAATGLASFLYEIAWIRMLSLVLGSSVHAFELMLSAFISGLAIGGWLIRSRINEFERPRISLGWIQLWMGVMAAATLLFYNSTFDLMRFVMSALERNEPGYLLFNLSSHLIAFVFMLPTTIFAGMTLPLITHVLVREGHGETSVGRVYAVNTFGSLLGVIVAVHLLMPLLGLKMVIVIGAMIDILMGVWLITRAPQFRQRVPAGAALLLLIGVCISSFARFDSSRMASGVFLGRPVAADRQVVFHQDGKSASVDVIRTGSHLSIATNGKVDAAVREGRPTNDEPTMVLLAALPYTLKPDSKRAAVIGFGSGITSHVLLASPHLERLDTIEIEPAMVNGAKLFRGYNDRVYDDPRSVIHIEDAKTFLASEREHYDLIVSEPSNPWISGVSGLFSREHYKHMRRHLEPDGLFVQWLHIYSFNIDLMASVMKALQSEFPYFVVYALNDTNLAIVGGNRPIPQLGNAAFQTLDVSQALRAVGVDSLNDLRHRYLGSERVLRPLFEDFKIQAHSDFAPVLDTAAIKARFLRQDALEIQRLRVLPIDVLGFVGDKDRSFADPPRIGRNISLHSAALANDAYRLLRSIGGVETDPPTAELTGSWSTISHSDCDTVNRLSRVTALQQLASHMLPYVSSAQWQRIDEHIPELPCTPSKWVSFLRTLANRDYRRALVIAEKFDSTEINNKWRTILATLKIMQGSASGRDAITFEQRLIITNLDRNADGSVGDAKH